MQDNKIVSFYFQLCMFSTLLPMTLIGNQLLRGESALPYREMHQKKKVFVNLPNLSHCWTHPKHTPSSLIKFVRRACVFPLQCLCFGHLYRLHLALAIKILCIPKGLCQNSLFSFVFPPFELLTALCLINLGDTSPHFLHNFTLSMQSGADE